MSAEDVEKTWPVLDTTPFPEFTEEGDLIEKDYGEFSAVHERGCGYMDPNACLLDMKAVLDREGVQVHMNSKVALPEQLAASVLVAHPQPTNQPTKKLFFARTKGVLQRRTRSSRPYFSPCLQPESLSTPPNL